MGIKGGATQNVLIWATTAAFAHMHAHVRAQTYAHMSLTLLLGGFFQTWKHEAYSLISTDSTNEGVALFAQSLQKSHTYASEETTSGAR